MKRVLCLLGVIAIAGCAPRVHAATSTVAPEGVAASAPAAAATTATPDAAVSQALNTIDSQLSAVNGQLNAANAGLHTSEGNPAQ
ncbi:MAG TPA: hypothetical protein VI434_12040 [Candidatus Dormibacteraeota bacterium]